jgi:hypothetical protein
MRMSFGLAIHDKERDGDLTWILAGAYRGDVESISILSAR